MFSRDGTRIAIGGGAFYGDGGILLVRLSTDEAELFSCTDLPTGSRAGTNGSPTVSGVCFSADDGHLAASTWAPRQFSSPTYLFEVTRLSLARRAELVHRRVDEIVAACSIGVLLYDEYVITRNDSHLPTDVIAISESPRGLRIKADRPLQHLTNSQMVVIRGNVITGGKTFDGVHGVAGEGRAWPHLGAP